MWDDEMQERVNQRITYLSRLFLVIPSGSNFTILVSQHFARRLVQTKIGTESSESFISCPPFGVVSMIVIIRC